MSQTPFEQAGSLRIGTVEFVSPDEIKVGLDIEAPESSRAERGRAPAVSQGQRLPADPRRRRLSRRPDRVDDGRALALPEAAGDAGLRPRGSALSACGG